MLTELPASWVGWPGRLHWVTLAGRRETCEATVAATGPAAAEALNQQPGGLVWLPVSEESRVRRAGREGLPVLLELALTGRWEVT